MAKPTEAQIKQLEQAHKDQYLNLVTANRLWIRLFNKIHGLPKTDKRYQSVFALGSAIARNAAKWYVRQWKFQQKANVPPVSKDIVKYFLVIKDEPKLLEQAKQYTGAEIKLNGAVLGFIPLLIWAVIALIVAFTAYEITDELTTTAQEKADLMKQTETTLKDLGVSGDQAAGIISQTQKEASEKASLFGGLPLGLLALAGAAAYFLSSSKKP